MFSLSTENLFNQVEGSLLVQCSMQKLCNFYTKPRKPKRTFFAKILTKCSQMFSSCLIIVQNIIFWTIFCVINIILPRGQNQICVCTIFFGMEDKLKNTSANDRKKYTDLRGEQKVSEEVITEDIQQYCNSY
jgi:hypothetical protein